MRPFQDCLLSARSEDLTQHKERGNNGGKRCLPAINFLKINQKSVDKVLADYIFKNVKEKDAGIAQLARASPCQGECRGFESRFPLQFLSEGQKLVYS